MTLPPPGYLAVRSSAKPVGYWKKPMFFAFADARIPLSSLELVHRKGVKKNVRKWKRDRLTKSLPPGEYEASNEALFRAMAIAAVSGSGILVAYRIEDTERPVALVNVRDVVDVAVSPKLSKKKRFAFTISTAPGKHLVFATRSEKERESWVKAVQHLARAVKETNDVEASSEYRSIYKSLVNKSAFGGSISPPADQTDVTSTTADEAKTVVAVAIDADVAGQDATPEEAKPEGAVAINEVDAGTNAAANEMKTEVEIEVDLQMSEVEDEVARTAVAAADAEDEASTKDEIAAEPEAGAEHTEIEESVEKLAAEATGNATEEAVAEFKAGVEVPPRAAAVEPEREVAPEAPGAASTAIHATSSALEPAVDAVEPSADQVDLGIDVVEPLADQVQLEFDVVEPSADQVDLEIKAFVAQMLDEIFRKAIAAAAASSEPESVPAVSAAPARVKKGMFSLYVPIWARRT